MINGVLVTFPPERRGGKIIPVTIEGVPEKYGRFQIDNSYMESGVIEHFEHEMRRRYERTVPSFEPYLPVRKATIKKVIFNDPATIVIWSDDTKTVVKCQEGDIYSKELGLAMCISKKFLGNKGNFNEEFKKWIPDETIKIPEEFLEKLRNGEVMKSIYNAMYELGKNLVEQFKPEEETPNEDIQEETPKEDISREEMKNKIKSFCVGKRCKNCPIFYLPGRATCKVNCWGKIEDEKLIENYNAIKDLIKED